MRRMTGQQPSFMTLGKNKAKIYMRDALDVLGKARGIGTIVGIQRLFTP